MYGAKPDENKLRSVLKDWGLMGFEVDVLEAWQKYRDDHILPFAGGWLDQPEWVRHDFGILDAIEAFHLIQHEKADAPSKGFFDIFRRGKK